MNDIKIIKRGRPVKEPEIFKTFLELKQGSFMILKKEDWKYKTLPGAHIIRRHTNREFKVETLINGIGWKITAL